MSRVPVDRGATAVEYALIVALFAVVVLGVVDALQTSAGDRLEQRSEVAAQPVEINGHFGPRETIPPSHGGNPPTPEPPPQGLASVSLGGGTSVWQNGAHWDGSVTVTTRDAAGNPLPAASVKLTVSDVPGAVELITDSTGSITYEVSKVHKDKTVTFSVAFVDAPGHVFAQPFPSLALSKPK